MQQKPISSHRVESLFNISTALYPTLYVHSLFYIPRVYLYLYARTNTFYKDIETFCYESLDLPSLKQIYIEEFVQLYGKLDGRL